MPSIIVLERRGAEFRSSKTGSKRAWNMVKAVTGMWEPKTKNQQNSFKSQLDVDEFLQSGSKRLKTLVPDAQPSRVTWNQTRVTKFVDRNAIEYWYKYIPEAENRPRSSPYTNQPLSTLTFDVNEKDQNMGFFQFTNENETVRSNEFSLHSTSPANLKNPLNITVNPNGEVSTDKGVEEIKDLNTNGFTIRYSGFGAESELTSGIEARAKREEKRRNTRNYPLDRSKK